MPRVFAPRPDPETFLPLKPIELLILTMLSAGERHGYGIRQDILEHTRGRVAPEAGNLYRHLRNLQEGGLLDELRGKAGSDDERRIHYRLLPLGRRVLAAEILRLRALFEIAEANRVIAPAGAS
jgi:DNA-binding PadR family transcriptional regulator